MCIRIVHEDMYAFGRLNFAGVYKNNKDRTFWQFHVFNAFGKDEYDEKSAHVFCGYCLATRQL